MQLASSNIIEVVHEHEDDDSTLSSQGSNGQLGSPEINQDIDQWGIKERPRADEGGCTWKNDQAHVPHWVPDEEDELAEMEELCAPFGLDRLSIFSEQDILAVYINRSNQMRSGEFSEGDRMEMWRDYFLRLVTQKVDDLMLQGKQRSDWHELDFEGRKSAMKTLWSNGRTEFKRKYLKNIETKKAKATKDTFEMLVEMVDVCMAWQTEDAQVNRNGALPSPAHSRRSVKDLTKKIADLEESLRTFQDALADASRRIKEAASAQPTSSISAELESIVGDIAGVLEKAPFPSALAACRSLQWESSLSSSPSPSPSPSSSSSSERTQPLVPSPPPSPVLSPSSPGRRGIIRMPLDGRCMYRLLATVRHEREIAPSNLLLEVEPEINATKSEIVNIYMEQKGVEEEVKEFLLKEVLDVLTKSGSNGWGSGAMLEPWLKSHKYAMHIYNTRTNTRYRIPLGMSPEEKRDCKVIHALYTGAHYDLIGLREGDKVTAALSDDDTNNEQVCQLVQEEVLRQERLRASRNGNGNEDAAAVGARRVSFNPNLNAASKTNHTVPDTDPDVQIVDPADNSKAYSADFKCVILRGMGGKPGTLKKRLRDRGIDSHGISSITKGGKEEFMITMKDFASTQQFIQDVAGTDGLTVKKDKRKEGSPPTKVVVDTESTNQAMLKKLNNLERIMSDSLKEQQNMLVSRSKNPAQRMADVQQAVNQRRACRFYAKGSCKKGASCDFNHVPRGNVQQAVYQGQGHTRACRFYAKGSCKKGASCDFRHVHQGGIATTPPSNPPSLPPSLQASTAQPTRSLLLIQRHRAMFVWEFV
jgi:hypothetical protein